MAHHRLLKTSWASGSCSSAKRSFDAAGKKYDYAQLASMAAKAKPLRSIVNLNDPRFLNPPDMPKAIKISAARRSNPCRAMRGELVRCCYETSRSTKYREVIGSLEELTGEQIQVIHIVGGGSQSQLLNQFTADACQRPVITGPVEATAMGNLLTQVKADGELTSLAEMRAVVRAPPVRCNATNRRRGMKRRIGLRN